MPTREELQEWFRNLLREPDSPPGFLERVRLAKERLDAREEPCPPSIKCIDDLREWLRIGK
jgi:hypothetical protein